MIMIDMSAVAFSSSSGEDVITRANDVLTDDVLDPLTQAFDEFYEITRTVNEIIDGGFKRVALQFPDELLQHTVPIYRKLRSAINEQGREDVEIYVLADTSYGSCCVDEVAAQHVDADVIVHYGHACMSQTYRLPIIYVFGRKPVDVDDCVERFALITNEWLATPTDKGDRTMVLRYDVCYTYRADDIARKLRERVAPLGMTVAFHHVPTRLHPSLAEVTSPSVLASASRDTSGNLILYVGGESLSLTNLLMMNAVSEVHSYHPLSRTTRLESVRTNKLLMRRYAAMQKARDAGVFGILVGTLGIAHYLPLIAQLRTLISRKRKKCYTISVGKINPAKLANFVEIECFVVVACPENSIVEAKEFLRPIITPYELEAALRPEQSWTSQYIFDFGRLLREEKGQAPEEEDDGRPVFSLVTGTYRHSKQFGEPKRAAEPESSAVILKSQDDTLAMPVDSAAAQFLQSRTYQGLEVGIGENPPSILEQGRSGIARNYQGG